MLNRKGQNTAEYAILIAIIIGAAIAMQTYIKRGFSGGVKYSVDRLKSTEDSAVGQYEPYYLEQSYSTNSGEYQDTEKTELGGKVTRTGDEDGHTANRSGYQTIQNVDAAD